MGVSNGCGHGRSRRARLVAVSCRVAARWRAPERESPGPPPDDPALRCGTDAFDLRALAYRLTRDRSGAGEGQQRWGYSPSHLLIAAMTTLITIVLATPPIRLTTGAADRSQQTGARGRWSRILILEPPAAALQLGDASRDATPPALRTAPRDHILNHEGLTAIWAACDKMGWPFGPFVKLLIATGQRRDEVAHMA